MEVAIDRAQIEDIVYCCEENLFVPSEASWEIRLIRN